MKSLKNIALMGMLCVGAISAQAATTVTLTVDPNVTSPGTVPFVLGDVNPPEPADLASLVQEINVMIGLPLGGHQASNFGSQGQTEYRSLNPFSPLPAANGAQSGGGTTTTIADAGFYYLAGKYDGPNGGLEVWDIGSLASGTTIIIPQNAFGAGNNQYGLSGWTLISATPDNPNFPPQGGVPDAGSTVTLLGCALLGVEALRRRFQKA